MKTLKALLLLLLVVVCPFVVVAQDEPPPSADLSVDKTGPEEAAPGSDVAYTVSVSNLGVVPALAVQLNDAIPPGMTFVSADQTSGPAFSCGNNAGVVQCTGGTLAVGETATFAIVFNISPSTLPGTFFSNVAEATTQSPEVNDENNEDSAVTSVPAPPADVGVVKTGPSGAPAGSSVIFTIVVSNAGPGVATAVSLTDVLDGLTFVALDQTPAASFSCSTPPVGSTGTITCTAGTMAVGASTTFQLTAAIPAEPSVGTYVNRATVVSTNDPNEENNESATVVVAGTTNVSVAKTGPTTANAGANISYTIVVTNAGPDPALDVTLTDVLPPNTTFVSLTPTSGAAASCGDTTCVIPSLDNGETSTFTLTLRAGDTTSITNTATVTSVSYDTNPANNESSVTTAITPQSDLRVAKSGPPTAIADTTITWTVTVANDGPSTASGVTLTDIVPAGTTLVSGAQTGGVAFNCVAGVTLVCTRASMAPGTSATFTVTAHILPGTTGTITNTAQVTAATADPDPADNQATAGAVVSPAQADLRVTKTGPAAVTAGTNITWTVSITNDGPSSASNVVLTDTLPAGTTFVASNQISGPTFTCLPAGNVVTCSAPSMPSATTATLTITAAVGLTTTGPITNTAEVTSTTADPDSSDNRATAVAAVGIAPADVSIAKTANTTEVFPGGTITYTVTATNSGPGEALEVVVTDVLPAGTTLVSAPGCTGTTTLTCNVGTLLAGAQATFTIIVQAPSTLGAFVNAASVASSTPDPTPTNNATSTTATAIAIPAGIPTLSEWALLLMALTLALIALRARAM